MSQINPNGVHPGSKPVSPEIKKQAPPPACCKPHLTEELSFSGGRVGQKVRLDFPVTSCLKELFGQANTKGIPEATGGLLDHSETLDELPKVVTKERA